MILSDADALWNGLCYTEEHHGLADSKASSWMSEVGCLFLSKVIIIAMVDWAFLGPSYSEICYVSCLRRPFIYMYVCMYNIRNVRNNIRKALWRQEPYCYSRQKQRIWGQIAQGRQQSLSEEVTFPLRTNNWGDNFETKQVKNIPSRWRRICD